MRYALFSKITLCSVLCSIILFQNCSFTEQILGNNENENIANAIFPYLFFSSISTGSVSPGLPGTGPDPVIVPGQTDPVQTASNCGDTFYFASATNTAQARSNIVNLTSSSPTPFVTIDLTFSCLYKISVQQSGFYDIRLTINTDKDADLNFNGSVHLGTADATPATIFDFQTGIGGSSVKKDPRTYVINYYNQEFLSGHFYEMILYMSGINASVISGLCGLGTKCSYQFELIPIPQTNCGIQEHAPVHFLYTQTLSRGDTINITGRNPEDICFFKLTDSVNTPFSVHLTPVQNESMGMDVADMNTTPNPVTGTFYSLTTAPSGQVLTYPGLLMTNSDYRYFRTRFKDVNGNPVCSAGSCGFSINTSLFTDNCSDEISDSYIEDALRFNAPVISLNTPVTVDRLTRKATCIEKLNIDATDQFELWTTMPSGFNFQISTGKENVIVVPFSNSYEPYHSVSSFLDAPTYYFTNSTPLNFNSGSFRYIKTRNYTQGPGSNWKDCWGTECKYTYAYSPLNSKYVFETRLNANKAETADTTLTLYTSDGVTQVMGCKDGYSTLANVWGDGQDANSGTDYLYSKIICPKYLLTPGTYYLKVGIENSDIGPYALSMRDMEIESTACPQSSGNVGNPTNPDAFENTDDVYTSASTLNVGCANALDRTIDLNDVDWFKFVIP